MLHFSFCQIYIYSETVEEYQQTQSSHDVEHKSSADATQDTLLPSPGIILAQNKNQRADKVSIRLRGKNVNIQKRPHFSRDKNRNWALGQWRKDAVTKGLLNSRVFMSYSNAYPTLCYSIKPYKSNASTNGSAEQASDLKE